LNVIQCYCYFTARELELRALRKTVAECEEQNSTLQKHVEQMQGI